MRYLILLFLTVGISGCGEKPKPEVVVKRVYIKTKLPDPPAECKPQYENIKPLPKKADLNEMTEDSALQRAGRLTDREVVKPCLEYVNKATGKKK